MDMNEDHRKPPESAWRENRKNRLPLVTKEIKHTCPVRQGEHVKSASTSYDIVWTNVFMNIISNNEINWHSTDIQLRSTDENYQNIESSEYWSIKSPSAGSQKLETSCKKYQLKNLEEYKKTIFTYFSDQLKSVPAVIFWSSDATMTKAPTLLQSL